MAPKTTNPSKDFNRRRVIAVLGSAIGIVFLLYLFVGEPGQPDLPDDAVAVVEGVGDGVITREEVDTWTKRALAGQQGPAPKPDTAQYKTVQLQVIDFLIQRRWARGEAGDRGIEVTKEEVADEIDNAVEQLGRKEFERRKKEGNFSDDDVREELRFTVTQRKLDESNAGAAEVSDEEVEALYEANKDTRYTEPAGRKVRVILNKDRARVEQALEQLRANDSPGNWKKVAAEFSTDQVTKNSGGLLRQPITESGSAFGEAFDKAVFDTATGEFAGPIETERGFWGLQVIEATDEDVLPLNDALRDSIRNEASLAKQQLVAASQQQDFRTKWLQRTACSDFVYDLQDEINEEQAQPGAAPIQVPSCPQDPVDLIDEQRQVDDAEQAAAQGIDTELSIPSQVQVPAPIAPGTAAPELLQNQSPRGPVRPKTVGDPCQDVDENGQLVAEADPCGPDPEGGAPAGIDPSALDPGAVAPGGP